MSGGSFSGAPGHCCAMSCRLRAELCSAFRRSRTSQSDVLTLSSRASLGYTLNELPQPQAEVAFGFFTWNAEPTISST